METSDKGTAGQPESTDSADIGKSGNDSGIDGSDASATNGTLDPAAAAAPRKRGRPSGKSPATGSTGGKAAIPKETKSNIFVDKKTLGQQLCGIHALIAMATKQPVLAITDQEGDALAKSLVDIADYYQLTASKGILLWVNFGAVAAMIYGPKVMPLIKAKPKPERAGPSLVPANAVNFAGA